MIVDHPIFHLRQDQSVGRKTAQPFSLQVMRRLLDVLGQPQRKFHRVLIAGTNGKGSTSHMLAALLRAHGLNVGLYTSPHVIALNERIALNQMQIDDENLLELLKEIEEKSRQNQLQPSFFEYITAAAELYFARHNIDWGVMEVGLGGRLDATHADAPEVAVLTPIDFDHMQYLGSSIEEIASEKSTIIPERGLALSASQEPAVQKILESRAREMQAPLLLQGRDFDTELNLPTLCAYQRRNAALALAVYTAMLEHKLLAPGKMGIALEEVMVRALPQGRFQWFETDPPIIFDGAHNPHAMYTLFEAIKEKGIQPQSLHVVLAVRQDKDWQEMLALLPADLGSVTTCSVNATTDLGPAAFVPAALLAEALRPLQKRVFIREEPREALKQAQALAKTPQDFPLREGKVLVTGSFYLLGKLLPTIQNQGF